MSGPSGNAEVFLLVPRKMGIGDERAAWKALDVDGVVIEGAENEARFSGNRARDRDGGRLLRLIFHRRTGIRLRDRRHGRSGWLGNGPITRPLHLWRRRIGTPQRKASRKQTHTCGEDHRSLHQQLHAGKIAFGRRHASEMLHFQHSGIRTRSRVSSVAARRFRA